MKCKSIFSIIITTIYICNIQTNVSTNENIRNTYIIFNNNSLSSDSMDLVNNTINSDSDISLHSNNNTLLNDKYMKLPLQKNNIIDNNNQKSNEISIVIDDNKFNITNEQNNKDIILHVNDSKLQINNNLDLIKRKQ